METRVWLNRSHPQYLMSATLLLYFNAVAALIFWPGVAIPIQVATAGVAVAAGYGVANSERLGYMAGVGLAGFLVAGAMLSILPFSIFSLMFDGLLLFLLLNEESREYQRIWFK